MRPRMDRIILESADRIQSIWLNGPGLNHGRIEIEATETCDRFGVHLGPRADFHISYPIGTKIRVE